MYKSPIEIFQTDIEYQLENDIMNMIQKYGITVDKDELIKALRYDRDQYDKGYADGKRDAIDELVRCKDCKHWEEYCFQDEAERFHYEKLWGFPVSMSCGIGECRCEHWKDNKIHETSKNDYCSYAERKEQDDS